ERPGRLRPRKEVDVDPPDASRAELDVAGAAPVICGGLLASLRLGDQGRGDDASGPFREHARLRYSDCRDVPDGVHTRKASLERSRIDGHVAVLGHPTLEDDLGG